MEVVTYDLTAAVAMIVRQPTVTVIRFSGGGTLAAALTATAGCGILCEHLETD